MSSPHLSRRDDRATARASRQRGIQTTAAWLTGLVGIALMLASPLLAGRWQTPLLTVGMVAVVVPLVWLSWRAADDRCERLGDRIVEADQVSRDAIREAVLDLAAAVCTVVDDLDQHTTRDAILLRRVLEDLLAAHPIPPRPLAAPTSLLVPDRPEVDDPTTEVPAATEPAPAEPGPLDADWTWTPAPEQEDANP